ncbi:UDPGP type 1 family protein [Bacillus sp. SD088]|uniref:UDPGP type 1 family protein n=1 Tax=Bacillus sp. SD088 TaxID=2782012 RepID=UPI001A95956A|nr:UDPGP type 1 family protein [Bacillus sp. SD088]MBO0992828.1 UDPGP type 1 family protein [Bacillus sp. SD088]
MDKYKLLKERLTRYQQEHLLSFFHELKLDEQEALLQQIEGVDLNEVEEASRQLTSPRAEHQPKIMPIGYEAMVHFPPLKRERLEERGLNRIRQGKVAVLLLAGGQGTRLGHDGPKGTISLGDSSEQSLFALQAKRLRLIEEKAGAQIPWYIMTSPSNDKETKAFFKRNHYFHCNPKQVRFFQQELMPTLTLEGKLILESPATISMAPNGNGGVFSSMKSTGVWEDMKEKEIEWVFMNNIDNALVQVADPVFIGFAEESGAAISSKAVKKCAPDEKVGLLCLADGRPHVVEYSELNLEEGINHSLTNANIGIHLFHMSFLEKAMNYSLPYHFAHKVIPKVDKYGRRMQANSPNGYKLEKFYFDVLPLAESMSVLQVEREQEFAPIKQRTGEDSLESARKLIFQK